MKFLLLVILILHITNAFGQNLTASLGFERTVSATESQFSVAYETRRQWALGAFYQTAITMKPFKVEGGSNAGSWYGLYLNSPLMRSQKVSFYAQLRTGLVDEKFIVIVPSFETRMR